MVALPGFLSKLFDSNARDIAKYQAIVTKINALEEQTSKLTSDGLRAKTEELKKRVQDEYAAKRAAAEPGWTNMTDQQIREADRRIYDPILDAVLPEAFALVREAAKRTIGLRHYDVQLIGGMVLHDGRIAEMRTGEGKTLVATLPLYLNALLGKGAHLVTANDYLSKRDAVWNGPIYDLLGMSLGIIQGQSPETGDEGGSYIYDPTYESPDPRYTNARESSRREAYACDITYGTNNEYGFDYLRDNMAFNKDDLVQGALHYAIVDEVDSILIDEARTPLIISGMVEQSTEMYAIVDAVVAQMKRGIDDPKNDKDNPDADKNNPNIHYIVDEKAKTATITDAGVTFVERALRIDNLSDKHDVMHYLTASMKAHGVFRKDIDYVAKDNGEGPEIIIVDENTGRLMFGRRYSDGLHQAIEAKEHVEVKNESQTLATITFQNYFRLYSKLGGMTGTAKTEEDEFRKIYALDVVQVPTNRPVARVDQSDVIYKSEEHKLRGITSEILRIYCKQQPVLVGTRSIEMSERVSHRLTPDSLKTLCMIEVAREKLEASKSIAPERRAAITATLNRPQADLVTTPAGSRFKVNLSLPVLKPTLKELGVDDDPLSPANMNSIAKLFEISDAGLDFLEEGLTHGIPHNVLNAKFHEKEAIIIAEAGRKGAVTIATNMAGRGVDILLGGKHVNQELPPVDGSLGSLSKAESVAHEAETGDAELDAETAVLQDYRRNVRPSVLDAVTTGALTDAEHKKAADEVRKLGGLFILGTERHESRRIDNQLRGRSGRQGDPGESRFFVSLEDELWRLFGDRANHPMLRTWEEHLSMDNAILSKMVQRAQRKVEEHYFESRKNVLNYDDVMNRQRELIYKERRRILEGVNLRDTILFYISENIKSAVDVYCGADTPSQEWQVDELFNELDEYFMLTPSLSVSDLQGKSREQMVHLLSDFVTKVYESRELELEQIQGPDAMRDLERWMALRAVNSRWMEHLANMDYLREGIHLRSYEQKDPLLIYQKEAFDEFERMQQAIQDDIVRNIFRIQIVMEQPAPPPPPMAVEPIRLPPELKKPKYSSPQDIEPEMEPRAVSTNRNSDGSARVSGVKRDDGAPPDWKGGRNDPCWCGSGQKYKKCHGK
jgi:preprotein translocase subunit SecA